MVVRKFIKCDTCGNIILVRYQVGAIDPAPIFIACDKCGGVLKGTFYQTGKEDFKFINATIIEPEKENQIICFSTEFPVTVSSKTDYKNFSPFMSSMKIFGQQKIMEYGSSINMLREIMDKRYLDLENIIELFKNEKFNYAQTEIEKKFQIKPYANISTYLSCAQLTYLCLVKFYDLIIDPNYIQRVTCKLYGEIFDNIKSNKDDLKNFFTHLNEFYDVKREYMQGVLLMKRFLEKINSFFPLILLTYDQNYTNIYGEDFFLTTFDFTELKNLYVDLFEYLSRASTILYGFYNLSKNKSCDDFRLNDCKSIKEYFLKSNGNKRKLIEQNTVLREYYLNTLDNKIRNGIGHFNTSYNSQNQIIKYFPYNDTKKKNDFEEIYLIDFAFIIVQQIFKVNDGLLLQNKWFNIINS